MDLPGSLHYNFRMETITLSNGRITIPSRIRRQLGIKEGTHIRFDIDGANKKIILTPITREYVHSLRGKYKGRGLMKALMAEKKREMA
jgi:AbrB family looped-hinge helix DNA binding protein